MYFNSQTNWFYDPDVHKIIPDGAIEISNIEYERLLAGLHNGQQITSNEKGLPVLVVQGKPDFTTPKIL